MKDYRETYIYFTKTLDIFRTVSIVFSDNKSIIVNVTGAKQCRSMQ